MKDEKDQERGSAPAASAQTGQNMFASGVFVTSIVILVVAIVLLAQGGGSKKSSESCAAAPAAPIAGWHYALMSFPNRVDAATAAGAKPVGTHTAHLAEATDAKYGVCAGGEGEAFCAVDGESGDTNYPHGALKVLATVGESNPHTGHMLVGVPDGMGAYLLNDDTVRFVFQSESYGPLNWWCREVGCGDSYPFIVNTETGATFTGSHVMYIDYEREGLAKFMTHDDAAAPLVKDSGNIVEAAYNLHGDLIQKRNQADNCCSPAPHFSTRRASRATASPARGSRARSSRSTGAGTAPSRTSSTTARGNSSTTRRRATSSGTAPATMRGAARR